MPEFLAQPPRPLQSGDPSIQLVRDAAMLTVKLSKLVGIRALIVQAKDERARKFYERLNFEPFPANPLRLFVLTKNLLSLTA